MDPVGKAIPTAAIVVIVEDEERRVAIEMGFGVVEEPAEIDGGNAIHETELRVHGELQLVVVCAVHLRQVLDAVDVGFADEHAAGKLVGDLAQLAQHIVNLRQIVGVLARNYGIAESIRSARDALIAQLRVFEERGDGVQPESGNAALQPEPHGVVHGVAHFGIAPVEVRLLFVES